MALLTLKEEAKKYMADVPNEYAFWCADGRYLKNIEQLKQALDTMSDETYAYHVNEEKNDFAKWVRDIMGDEQLAKDLEKATSRARASRLTGMRMSILGKRLS